jgi:hypothetical protein
MKVIYNKVIPINGYKCVNLFGVLYVLEWLWHLIRLRDTRAAYRAISFEREAYAHEGEADYLKIRKKFNQYKKD